MDRPLHRTAAVAFVALCVGGSAVPAPPPPTGASLGAREGAGHLAAGEVGSQRLELAAGRFVAFEVEQIEGDVAVELIDPAGRTIARSDLPASAWLIEVVAALTPVPGPYELRVRTAESQSPARFAWRLAVERRRRADDGRLLAAIPEWLEGLRLKEVHSEAATHQALEMLRTARAEFEGAGAARWQAEAERELGGLYRRLGDSQAARAALFEAVALSRDAGDPVVTIKALNDYGSLLGSENEKDSGLAYLEDALARSRALGSKKLEALSLNNLGVLYFRVGEIDRVAAVFEDAVTLRREIGDRLGLATTLSNLGAAYRQLGRSSSALIAYREALDLAVELGDEESEFAILNNMGVLHKSRGEIRQAIDDYSLARILAEATGDVDSVLVATVNQGSLYRSLGEPRRALELLEESLVLSDRHDSPRRGRVLQTLAEVERDLGEYELALEHLEVAVDHARSTQDGSGEAYALYAMGRCALDLGQPERALEHLSAAEELQRALKDQPGLAATLRGLSVSQRQMGRLETARPLADAALALAQGIGDPSLEAEAREERAFVLEASGALEAARRELELSLSTTESLRAELVSGDLRASFLSRSHLRFLHLARLLTELASATPGLGHAEEAFLVGERMRARSLVESMAEAGMGLGVGVDRQLEDHRRDLTARLSDTQRKLTQGLEAELSSDAIERLRSTVAGLHRELQEVDSELKRADPRWAAMHYPRPVDLAAAQALLEPGQALVSYLLGPRESLVFVVTPGAFEVSTLAGEASILPAVKEWRRLLEQPSRRSWGRLLQSSRGLYDVLLAPVADVLRDAEELIVVPDGVLHYLPFEALVVGEISNGSQGPEGFLLNRWSVSYVPSASALASLRGRTVRSSQASLVAFGDPETLGAVDAEDGAVALRGIADRSSWRWRRLRGARSEVETIAGLFDRDLASVFVGLEAEEARFKSEELVRSARYLHFASHALIDSETPGLSALLMTPGRDGREDGLLQVHEVLGVALSADLVVLSGCETALGREVRAEGLVGLPQAFLYAGARAVAVSLWPVEDQSTGRLMERFYSELRGGASAGEALRRAKIGQMQEPETAHPYYWAPFVLVGAS